MANGALCVSSGQPKVSTGRVISVWALYQLDESLTSAPWREETGFFRYVEPIRHSLPIN
jgi:hypothetical protein